MKEYDGKKIVFRVEDDMNPREIYCTTYQMRNFYRQFADGFFSSLDVMNYIQHHKVVTMMRKDDQVLDVCCGRGLLLPLIRWYKRDIAGYTGVDISEKNIKEQLRRSGIKTIENLDEYYSFPIKHVLCSAEEMDQHLQKKFDLIVYTSAIEHMQKEAGYKSLQACHNVLKPGKILFISCPNTREKKDPYDTQYKAHLYEWDLDELSAALKEIGFELLNVFGLVSKRKDFDDYIEKEQNNVTIKELYQRFSEYLPNEWLMSFFPILFPEVATEIAIIASKPLPKRGLFSKRGR